jgi:hypothetical protein
VVSTVVTGAVVLGGAAVGTTAASAVNGDRPKNVAAVTAGKQIVLTAGGSLTVTQKVECDPGWEPAELDAQVNQGDAVTSSFTIPAVACDGKWHTVTYDIGSGTGGFAPGKATISSQFLVTNVESGDSAGAHDQRTGTVKLG